MIYSHKADKDQSGKKPRRLRRTTVLIILGVIVVSIAWLGILQRNNLKALYLAATSDTETLKQKQEEQDKQREELLHQYGLSKPDVSQPEGTAEDSGDGSTAAEDGTGTSQTPAQEPAVTPSQEPEQSSDQMQAQLQSYVDQLYQVEAKYREFLSEMIEATKEEFWSLPHDQQTKENKLTIVQSKMDGLIAQENACDAEVEKILSDMQATLKQYGQSNELVDEIRTYYQESKATWKAEKMTELYK